jgi:hypothetical protein
MEQQFCQKIKTFKNHEGVAEVDSEKQKKIAH